MKKIIICVRKEVILVVGVIYMFQILQLSGIGFVDFLKCVGILVKVDFFGVGYNFQDYIFIFVVFFSCMYIQGC